MGSPLNRMVNRFDAHCIISRPDISSQPSYLVRGPRVRGDVRFGISGPRPRIRTHVGATQFTGRTSHATLSLSEPNFPVVHLTSNILRNEPPTVSSSPSRHV
jgi:hypothetical protein